MQGRRPVFYYGAELRDRHRGSSCPTHYHIARKIEEVQHTPYALTHHVVDTIRMIIERRDGDMMMTPILVVCSISEM